jgi:hypothetical protein
VHEISRARRGEARRRSRGKPVVEVVAPKRERGIGGRWKKGEWWNAARSEGEAEGALVG